MQSEVLFYKIIQNPKESTLIYTGGWCDGEVMQMETLDDIRIEMSASDNDESQPHQDGRSI